jgi:hypothetical protein
MKRLIVTLAAAILTICLFAFTGMSQPGVVIYDMGNGNMAIVAGHCTPFTNVVLQVTTDFTDWTAIATNMATGNDVATFYVPKTNSVAFFRVYQ